MLAPPWIPVPPMGCGEIEFVVALLSDALAEQGHDVELFVYRTTFAGAADRPVPARRPHE